MLRQCGGLPVEHRCDLAASPLVDRREQAIEGLAEERDAVFEQPVGHVIERDSDALERGDRRTRVLDVVFEARPQPAVIAEGLERRWRNRVDRVTADQLFNVAHVAIAWVLGTGARPEETLWMRSPGREPLPLGGTAERQVALIGELRVGNRDCSEEVRQ